MNDIQEKIKNIESYLSIIKVVNNYLLELMPKGKMGKALNKQKAIFTEQIFKKKNYHKYVEKTEKNFKKYEKVVISDEIIGKLKKECKDSFLAEENVSKAIKIINNHSLNLITTLKELALEYIRNNNELENLKSRIEEKKKEEQEKKEAKENIITNENNDYIEPFPTKRNNKNNDFQFINIPKKEKTKEDRNEFTFSGITIKQKKSDDKNIIKVDKVEQISNKIIEGTKKDSIVDKIRGNDEIFANINYLYGLSADILRLMENEQHVKIDCNFENNVTFSETYIDPVYNNENVERLFKKYNVSDVSGLLDKYEDIRNKYFKKYSKLSNIEKDKCAIKNIEHREISTSLDNFNTIGISVYKSLINENFLFPPSKEEIISLVNSRILNGRSYEIIKIESENDIPKYKPYINGAYYINLTKNMNEYETAQLYHRIIGYVDSMYMSQEAGKATKAMIQMIFCSLIVKKTRGINIGILNNNRLMAKIAKEYLNEELIYKSNNIENDEQQNNIIYKNYIKYRVEKNLKKEKYLSFGEYVIKNYEINLSEPENLEEIIKEEIKGKSR